MKMSMKRRLEKIEQRTSREEQIVIVLQQDGESGEAMADRLGRWKAGEDVPGVGSEKPYQGGHLKVINVCFGRSEQQ